jgi:hypothetical protein
VISGQSGSPLRVADFHQRTQPDKNARYVAAARILCLMFPDRTPHLELE